MSGTVDVAVAESKVLLLVLGVELGGGDGGDSSTDLSNHMSSLGNDGGSSHSVDSSDSRGSNSADSRGSNGADSRGSNGADSRGSNSVDSSNSRGSNGADSRSSNNMGSSYSRSSIATCIGIGIAKSSSSISTIGTIESISVSTDASNQGRDDNLGKESDCSGYVKRYQSTESLRIGDCIKLNPVIIE